MGFKSRFDHLLKFSPLINKIFTEVGGTSLRALGKLVKREENMILFSSDIGKSYTGSPRAIYERMRELGLDERYRCVWAFVDPYSQGTPDCEQVRLDSFSYFVTALKAGRWITDVNIERGLRFKPDKTKYLNTWHGSTLKTLGKDIHGRIYYDCSSIDWLCVNSSYDEEIFSRAFGVSYSAFLETGLPRNDELYEKRECSRIEYALRAGLPPDKKILLYAPTWRDSTDGGATYDICPPIHPDAWREKLGDDWIVVFRMHPITQEAMGIPNDEFWVDRSRYQPLNDLLLASNMLVTDYSSLAFDYSILGRPVLCFGYDLDTYAAQRGLYVDLNQIFPLGVQRTEEDLLKAIAEIACAPADGRYSLDRSYNEYGGEATNACINLLFGEDI